MNNLAELRAAVLAQGRIFADPGGPQLIGPRGLLPIYTVRWFEWADDTGTFHYQHERSFWGCNRAMAFMRTMVWMA